MNIVTADSLVDLGKGFSSEDLFPIDAISNAATTALRDDQGKMLQYADETGLLAIRYEIARFMERQTGQVVNENHLLITNGASHALELILKMIVPPKSRVVVEDPTYFEALNILHDWNVELVPVRMKNNGLDTDHLRQILAEGPVSLVYTIPIHHNPTGVSMSPDRRRDLIALSEKHDFFIASDEAYRFVGQSVGRSLYTATEQKALAIGSFSKIVAPGMRLGWIHSAPENIQALSKCGVLKSGGGVGPLASTIAARMLRDGFDAEPLDALNRVYRDRRNAMVAALSENLDSRIAFVPPTGGYFCWVEMPHASNVERLQELAAAQSISFRKGNKFSYMGNFANALRLCYTYHDAAVIHAATKKLCGLMADALK